MARPAPAPSAKPPSVSAKPAPAPAAQQPSAQGGAKPAPAPSAQQPGVSGGAKPTPAPSAKQPAAPPPGLPPDYYWAWQYGGPAAQAWIEENRENIMAEGSTSGRSSFGPMPTIIPTPTPLPTPTPTPNPFSLSPGCPSNPNRVIQSIPSQTSYNYGRNYQNLLQTTGNVYLQRYGRPDLLLLVAAAYDAEINRMMRIPEARDAATEAFGRGLWEARNNYGEEGVYFYLGALQSVRMRVDAEDAGQELYDFDEALSQARLIVEPSNSDWCNGYQPTRPAWWGNVSEEILSDNSPLPTFRDAFLEKRVGEQQDQIWYISPDGIFFIVSQAQQRYLCGNQSCVSPMYFYRTEP